MEAKDFPLPGTVAARVIGCTRPEAMPARCGNPAVIDVTWPVSTVLGFCGGWLAGAWVMGSRLCVPSPLARYAPVNRIRF
jgi:hypothetical protein